jgi:hypothetical protein
VIVFADDADSEPAPEQRFEQLLELPPSAKLVYKVLEDDAPLTQQQVRTRTWLPARTTRDALSKLETADLVEEQLYPMDARKRLYVPRSVAEPDDVG